MKKIYLPILLILGAILTSFIVTPGAHALSGSDWRPGRIIDDVVFYNKNSMSVNDIQRFLDSKVTCDRNGTKTSEYGGGTRAQYGASRGNPAPYTCLPQYYENTTTKENNLEGRNIPSGAKSAAQIIWDSAQTHGVNPQVLIVLLQKEQALVTDEWPFPIQYRSATGYGCPDTAACDSTYYGFYNQIENAAKQFIRYRNNPTSYNHWPNANNNIRWSPNAACGSSNVYIENQATAGLYNYTPYQPNQAALNNLYGTGDNCSAYGNRNFWRMFSEWFGSTYGMYKWTTDGYQVFDKTESARLDPGRLEPGQTYIVKLPAFNVGTATWKNSGANPFTLATRSNGNSFLCHSSWLSCNRAVTLQEASVAPGQLGNFKFTITVPYKPGAYREAFKPVAEMLAWANDVDETFGFVVTDPGSYSWENQGYRVFTEDRNTQLDPGKLEPGKKYVAVLTAKNTGSATWKNNGPTPVNLGTAQSEGRDSRICVRDNWGGSCNRPTRMDEAVVTPGQTAHFSFSFQAPYQTGYYREFFKPVAEMFTWFGDSNEPLGINVASPGSYSWENQGYRVMNLAKDSYLDPGTLQKGQKYVAILTAKNTGTATWKNNGPTPVNLGTFKPDRNSAICDTATWATCNRPVALKETSVTPGQTGHFEFIFTAPNQTGYHREYFKPVAEMFTWFPDTYEALGIVSN